ncbi:MAG: ROK family protein [Flavobacteriaceae bacterium]|nr:ROK family protein [Flavobacteriaceae bacterium]
MKKNIVIGVDVGGSHITSAAVDLDKLTIIDGTLFENKVDSKASKEVIFESWAKAINKSVKTLPAGDSKRISFAIPGPFQYKKGVAMFEINDKYENLYQVSVPNELPSFLEGDIFEFRFLNDATSFGVGVARIGEAKEYHKVIALTLGTGFGSCFITNGIPQVNAPDVPKDGCLWDKPFEQGIADEYFSTRWFKKRYKELSSTDVKGVKEIAEADNEFSEAVFKEFGNNMAEFMKPVIRKYQPDLIVLGGNISNASSKFLPATKENLEEKDLDVKFIISSLMEEAAIIGSARLFEPDFWNQVKNDLPNI